MRRCLPIARGLSAALAAVFLLPSQSHAQSPASGYDALLAPRFEAGVRAWGPGSNLLFSSDDPGVPGTAIDGRHDLAIGDRVFPQFSASATFARRHTISLEYTPIAFDGSATLTRDIAYSGHLFPAGARVHGTMDWTAYQVGYEYALLARARWRAGVAVELKQTTVRAELSGNDGAIESRKTSVPVPAAGPAARVAITRRIEMHGRITAMAVPDSADRHYGGHYIDAEIAGSVALAPHVAFEAGWRSLDLRHLGEVDFAKITLRGLYVGGVIRR